MKPACVICGTELIDRHQAFQDRLQELPSPNCHITSRGDDYGHHCPQCGIEYHQVPKGKGGNALTAEEKEREIMTDDSRCSNQISVSWGMAVCGTTLDKDGTCRSCKSRKQFIDYHRGEICTNSLCPYCHGGRQR